MLMTLNRIVTRRNIYANEKNCDNKLPCRYANPAIPETRTSLRSFWLKLGRKSEPDWQHLRLTRNGLSQLFVVLRIKNCRGAWAMFTPLEAVSVKLPLPLT